MDLINSLTSGLGIETQQAQGLAGGVLGMIKNQVAEQGGANAADQMQQAIPEMGGWQQAASNLMSGSGGSGGSGGSSAGMLGAAASAFGGGGGEGLLSAAAGAIGGKDAKQAAQLVDLLGKLGLDPKYGAMAAPMVLDFLKERLPSNVLNLALKAAPFLTGGGGSGGDDSNSGGIAGALGGLF